MAVYGEDQVPLIAKIFGRNETDVFNKWLDLRISKDQAAQKFRRSKWTENEDNILLQAVADD